MRKLGQAQRRTCRAGVGVQVEVGLLLALLLQRVELHVRVPRVAVVCPLDGHPKQLLHQLQPPGTAQDPGFASELLCTLA